MDEFSLEYSMKSNDLSIIIPVSYTHLDVYKRQVFGSQKGAITILEKNGIAFEISNLYQERYLEELDAYCKEQKRVQREKQKKFKIQHPEWFTQYPKLSLIHI